MRGERIEALAFMYAAGVALGAVLNSVIHGPWALLTCFPVIFFLSASWFMATRPRDIAFLLSLYLAGGAFCFLTANAGEIWRTGTMDPVTSAATSSAQWLKDVIDHIPYQEKSTGGLVKALITGDRSGISRDTAGIFRQSGASHILALSGMHLGILYMILLWIMVPLGNTPSVRKFKGAITIAITFFYSLATGFSPSITRAFLFITINEVLKINGRKKSPVRVFASALFIQLTLNPLVITSVGFQLSYLAMCGITLLYPTLNGWYPQESRRKLSHMPDMVARIWQAASLSISCQVFTAPLVWIRFHSFPTFFLLTNLIAMPVTSAVMVLSVLTVTLSAIGACPDILVATNEKTVSALTWILTVISQM